MTPADGTARREAVVLAGGRSERFDGGDKAVAPLAGRPLVRRVVDRLSPAVAAVVVNCRDEQTDRLADALDGTAVPWRFAVDDDPDRGPLGGIRTGLAAVETPYAAVVACDMPFVDPALLDHLFERAAGRDAAVPQLDDGWYQTTQAVYRTAGMAAACERALAAGEGKVLAALSALDYVTVPEREVLAVASLRTFENVNTRDDLAAAARLLTD